MAKKICCKKVGARQGWQQPRATRNPARGYTDSFTHPFLFSPSNPGTEYRVQSTECKVQSTEYRVQSCPGCVPKQKPNRYTDLHKQVLVCLGGWMGVYCEHLSVRKVHLGGQSVYIVHVFTGDTNIHIYNYKIYMNNQKLLYT